MRKQMESGTLIVLLLIFVVGINVTECRNIKIESFEELFMPKVIDRCRAACLGRFLFEMDNIVQQSNCQEHSNCAMCWDFCESLIVKNAITFHSMCINHTCVSWFCFHSQSFYWKFSKKNKLSFFIQLLHLQTKIAYKFRVCINWLFFLIQT